MMQKTIFAYLYDFLSILIEKDDLKEKIEKIILFGSTARGDFDEESDIDIFIDIKNLSEKKEIEKIIGEAINTFEKKTIQTWHLRKIQLPIKTIVGKLDEDKWRELKYEIISTGILLFGKYEQLPENLQHSTLISYSLNKLKQPKKMRFLRKLYGYKVKKGKKTYDEKGILTELKGTKITTNQIMVNSSDSKSVLEIIKSFKMPYTIKEIWVH